MVKKEANSINKAPTPEEDNPSRQTTEDTPEKKEFGGPKGLEPTRYGDWDVAGRCTDF